MIVTIKINNCSKLVKQELCTETGHSLIAGETKHGYCLEMESHFSIKPVTANKDESNKLHGKYETESSL